MVWQRPPTEYLLAEIRVLHSRCLAFHDPFFFAQPQDLKAAFLCDLGMQIAVAYLLATKIRRCAKLETASLESSDTCTVNGRGAVKYR